VVGRFVDVDVVSALAEETTPTDADVETRQRSLDDSLEVVRTFCGVV
jgi:hypothetical protein